MACIINGQEALFQTAPAYRLNLPESYPDRSDPKVTGDYAVTVPVSTISELSGWPGKPTLTFEQKKDLLLSTVSRNRSYERITEHSKHIRSLYDSLSKKNTEEGSKAQETFLILFVYHVRSYSVLEENVKNKHRFSETVRKSLAKELEDKGSLEDYLTHVFDTLRKDPKSVQTIALLTRSFVQSTFHSFVRDVYIGASARDSLDQNPALYNQILEKLTKEFQIYEDPLKAITFFTCFSSATAIDISYDLYPYDSDGAKGRPFISGVFRLYLQILAIMMAYY